MASYKTEPTPGSSGIAGNIPDDFMGKVTVDGDAYPFLKTPNGTRYLEKSSETANPKLWTKRQNNARDDDWGLGFHTIKQRILYSQFTDGGSTAGTLDLTETIPQGAWVLRTILLNVTGFTGDTSATMIVGETGDTDRYMTGTPSVFTTANAIDLGAPSGTQIHTAAKTVKVTVTSNADFTSVAAGAATVCILYWLP